jgi:LmbE family N-acetylglucosaminyl deacetylase
MMIGARTAACLAVAVSSSVAGMRPVLAQEADELNVLIVTAHPDDEAMFAGAVYKITHELNGNVDLALVTDGSGGFRYTHLAEPIYGLDLTDEHVARQHLPAIRKQELMAAGKIIGIRNYFFLDQLDHEFTTSADTVMRHVWDAAEVLERLRRIMTRVEYDFVFVHLPVPTVHGHHQAASILALQAARSLDTPTKPVVLGSQVGVAGDTTRIERAAVPGFPITKLRDDTPAFVFDMTQPVDDTGRLDYRIVVMWLIAEHRSQGTMQMLVFGGWDRERFWLFEANDPESRAVTEALFQRLGGR